MRAKKAKKKSSTRAVKSNAPKGAAAAPGVPDEAEPASKTDELASKTDELASKAISDEETDDDGFTHHAVIQTMLFESEAHASSDPLATRRLSRNGVLQEEPSAKQTDAFLSTSSRCLVVHQGQCVLLHASLTRMPRFRRHRLLRTMQRLLQKNNNKAMRVQTYNSAAETIGPVGIAFVTTSASKLFSYHDGYCVRGRIIRVHVDKTQGLATLNEIAEGSGRIVNCEATEFEITLCFSDGNTTGDTTSCRTSRLRHGTTTCTTTTQTNVHRRRRL